MPRKPRIEYPGACYHVMCRGDRREEIFRKDRDREIFLRMLSESCKREGWVIHAYVLMGNHYRLLVETVAGELSRGMQWFQTTYTARFNARHRLCDHLFQGCYKAVPIDPDEQYYWKLLGDYIHLNPVRDGLITSGNLRLDSYQWSSYPYLLTGKIYRHGSARNAPWGRTGGIAISVPICVPIETSYKAVAMRCWQQSPAGGKE